MRDGDTLSDITTDSGKCIYNLASTVNPQFALVIDIFRDRFNNDTGVSDERPDLIFLLEQGLDLVEQTREPLGQHLMISLFGDDCTDTFFSLVDLLRYHRLSCGRVCLLLC